MGTDADNHLKSVLSAIKDKAPEAAGARIAAIEAVAVLGPKAEAAGPDLRDLLKDKSLVARGDRTQVRERAARSLARLGGETARRAIPALTDMLRDTNPNVRRAAVEALGTIGPDAIVAAPKLRELARTDPAVADAAQDALDRIEPASKIE
jgi:HEAT repeat protein